MNLNNSLEGSKKINFLELNEAEKIEFRRITDHCVTLVASQFERKVNYNSLLKSKTGYSIQLNCSKHNVCNAYWLIKLNITTNEANVICKRPCEHFFSTEPSI